MYSDSLNSAATAGEMKSLGRGRFAPGVIRTQGFACRWPRRPAGSDVAPALLTVSRPLLRLLLLILFAAAGLPTRAQNPSLQAATRPDFDIHSYRRAVTPDEELSLALSAYNEQTIAFSAYRFFLPALTPTSLALNDIGVRVPKIDLSRLRPTKTWTFQMGKTYPDHWEEREVKLGHLPPGVYLIRGVGAGVEKRTWIAVTEIALLTKRSRHTLLVYAAHARTGRPVAGLTLTATDTNGHRATTTTGGDGLCAVPWAAERDTVWLYGEKSGSPAFVLAGLPPAPDPFTIYMTTDRPIYRPGHTMHFKAVVRRRLEAEAPGGFVYRPYAGRHAVVEIRDGTDALLSRRTVTTNAFGSFDGDFRLAAETTLGSWQIVVAIGDFRSYASFDVQEYRKPEYTTSVEFERTHYSGGSVAPVTIESRYFFGQPVARAAVAYTVSFQPQGDAGDGNRTPEAAFSGSGLTDARGRLRLDVRTQRLTFNRTLQIHAVITDLSRRRQQADGSVLITAGTFHLDIEPDKVVYRAGEHALVTLHATDYDGKPVPTRATVRLVETKLDRNRRPYRETTARQVTTDAAGNGITTFTPSRPGYLELEAEAFDSNTDKITASAYLWVAGDEYWGYEYPTLKLTGDHARYRPGEVASVLLNTSLVTPPGMPRSRNRVSRARVGSVPGTWQQRPAYPDAWALVTVEGERLYRREIVHLTRRSTLLRVPLTDADFPGVEVNVTILQEKQIYQSQLRLVVRREEQKLQVCVTPDKERYAPGETATYTITTRDFRGRPAPAEVALGVVDASIYAIAPDTAPDMEGTFYGEQQIRIQTDFSFAAQYSGGAFQTMPAEAGGRNSSAGIRVRRRFADTAYWNAFVTTDDTGAARVSFTMPDNLTTWRATARAITQETHVGSTTQDVVATMPLLVRLTLPRFTVDGDRVLVSGIVHNYTGVARDVVATIEASGATLRGDAVRRIHLPAAGEQRLDWQAVIASNGGASSASGAVRFRVTADGGEGARDATELTLPALADGLKMVDVKAESLARSGDTSRLDISKLPAGATLTVTLTPTLVSALFGALDFLTAYPYGCAEQTMSGLLPDIAVAQALRQAGVNRSVQPDLPGWINMGLQKLYRYQHPDGGWHWWEFDETDGDMTAYVLYGLVQARDAGYLVDEMRINRGTEALVKLLAGEQEWNRRVEWMLTLAFARPGDIDRLLSDAHVNRDKLDLFGLAALALAEAQLGSLPGRELFAKRAAEVAHEIEARAIQQGTTARWSAAEGGYTWRNDDDEVTARALRAVLLADPSSPLIPKAVRWLMGNRAGSGWQSTRATAEVVITLARYLARTHELQPDFTARVTLDGKPVEEAVWRRQDAFAAPVTVTLQPKDWQGHRTLTVERSGVGMLYVTASSAYLIPSDRAKKVRRGIAVVRHYQILTEDPSRAPTFASGQDIEVRVDITADADYRYAMLEEPIPAGCEVGSAGDRDQPEGLVYEEGSGGYVRQEVRDNRVVFFFDALPKGRTSLTYHLHAETPGSYRALPGIGSLVYFPEIRGSSLPASAVITEIGASE